MKTEPINELQDDQYEEPLYQNRGSVSQQYDNQFDWNMYQDSELQQYNNDFDCNTYILDRQVEIFLVNNSSLRRYFANLSLSANGSSFETTKLQIDTGATCNTISYSHVMKVPGEPHFTKSHCTLHPYGNSTPIPNVGQVELLCERDDKYHTLMFQVLPDNVMKGKPGLLSGTDSVRLGLVQVNADEIFQLGNRVDQIKCDVPNACKPPPRPTTPLRIPTPRNLPKPGAFDKS